MTCLSVTNLWALVEYATDAAVIIIVAGMLLCIARLLRGPHLADRALAMDAITTHLMALVIVFMLRTNSLLLFDGVLVLALLGFLTTVAFAQYILRPHIRRKPAPTTQPHEETRD